jgi:hypothetical protein
MNLEINPPAPRFLIAIAVLMVALLVGLIGSWLMQIKWGEVVTAIGILFWIIAEGIVARFIEIP